MWGAGPPGGFGGPTATQSSAAAGLPFAGVPRELQARVERLLAAEPVHADPQVRWSPRGEEGGAPLTLRRLLAPRWPALAGAGLLVVAETVSLQAGPLLTQRAIDLGIVPGDTGALARVCAVYLLSVVISVLAGAGRVAWTARLAEDLLAGLRVRVFSHLQRLGVDFFTGERAGRVMTRMTSDVENLTQLLQDGLVSLAVQGLTMVVVTAVLVALSPPLAAVTLLAVVPAMVALTVWFRSASDRGYAAVRDRIAEVLADLSETLQGIRVVTASNRRRQNVTVHRTIVRRYRDANVRTARVNAVYGPGTDLIGVLGQVAVLAVGGRLVLDGRLSLGELVAFVLYLTAFFAPIQQLVQLYSTYQSGQASVVKLRELLATEPTVQEAPDAHDLPPIEGRIELERVSFGYDGRNGPQVLRRVDLVIAPGETVAFVGETGAGKSTIAKLVVRFHDPTEGRVLVDGHDLRSVTFASLRRQLGVVPQEPFLFAGTIRDNVAFARPGASDDEVVDACRAVGLGPLLERLPEGVHAPVHERGASLSAGERQLLALARAFMARPRVLVLDEATSNLDLASEARIERALDVVREGRTVLLVAHRLATAMRADRIVVVADGGIAEVGTHGELVARGGRYAALWAAHQQHLA